MTAAEGRLDFDGYDETGFERFCFDLLQELGFVNLDWRKGTALPSSPADRGRDIEALFENTDVDGSKRLERWFVDCKHYKSGVPPERLQGLLTWAGAERPDVALVIASGFLSNGAKDYLRQYENNNRPPFRIKFWEQPDLERLTRGKREFLDRFLRRDDLIGRADQEIPSLESLGAAVPQGTTDWADMPSGLRDLDRLTNGFRRAELAVIAGQSSMGKSALALQIALEAAINQRRSVLIFSLETSKERLVERIMCHLARIDPQRLRHGLLSDTEYERLAGALGPMGDAPIVIDDSMVKPSRLREEALEAKRRRGIEMIVLDYLQLMPDYPPGLLKSVARELQVPVIVVSQVSGAATKRLDKRPRVTDLVEPEELEQEADLILLLYRDDYYHRRESEKPGIAEVIVAKNRYGPTGTVEFAFHPELSRFDNLELRTAHEAE